MANLTKDEMLLQYQATLDTGDYEKGIDSIEKKTSKAETNVNDNMSGIGKGLKGLINPTNLAIGAFTTLGYQAGVAFNNYKNFELKLAEVNTLLKVSSSELETYGLQFRNLSANLGIDEIGLMDGAYQALSAGIKQEDLLGFLEKTSKGAKAGLTDTKTSIEAVTTVLNSYKLGAEQTEKVLDLLLTTQNKGVTTLGELGSYLGEVTPIASSLNISLEDLFASMAQITVNGNNTAKTATMLKSLLGELAKSGTVASKSFESLAGQSFDEFISKGGTIGEAMTILKDGADASGKSLIDMFGSLEAGNAALSLSGQNIDGYKEKLDALKDSAGELNKAYTLVTDNFASEWDKLKAQISNVSLTVMKPMVEDLTKVVRVFRQATDETENLEENTLLASKEISELYDKIEKLKTTGKIDTGSLLGEAVIGEKYIDDYVNSIQEEIIDKKLEFKIGLNEEELNFLQSKINDIDSQINSLNQEVVEKYSERGPFATGVNGVITNIEKKIKSLEQTKIDIQGTLNLATSSSREIENVDEKDLNTELLEVQAQEEERIRQESLKKEIEANKKKAEIEKQALEEEKARNEELKAFREQQSEEEKAFRDEQLIRQWNFLSEQGALKLQGKISDEELALNKEAFRQNELLLQEQFDIQQLEDLALFYQNKQGLEEQALAIEEEIIDRKIALDSKGKSIDEAKLKWETWAEKNKVDIQTQSADAILDTYTALASGQIKSLEDFKEFAKDSIAQLLLAKGQEHASIAISDAARGFSYLSNPLTAGMAPAAFSSAAKNAAIATAFGVGASALSGGDESETDTGTETTTTEFDTGIEDRTETAEAEGMLYVDVSDSAILSTVVTQIDEYLGNNYHTSIIVRNK